MKYQFIYAYNGKNQGNPETGHGSMKMILYDSNRITPKVIESACDLVRKELNAKGMQIDTIVPMGWFKYDEEENEE